MAPKVVVVVSEPVSGSRGGRIETEFELLEASLR
jgi:hypothetical protein